MDEPEEPSAASEDGPRGDFRRFSVESIAEAVRSGTVSARRWTQFALDLIEARDGDLHAFVAVDGDCTLATADEVDRRVRAGEQVGPLAGVPIGVKDEEDVIGYTTTFGSQLHIDDAPAATDSIQVARLRAAGAIVVGKTNLPEFAHKADTSNGAFPSTRNPWDPTRSAGGSSGGSGAALAAGLVPLATGSDAGGSIRIPSSVNGLSGFKPSLGRIPDGGRGAPQWLHLSVSAPMARTIGDTAYALDCVIGPDPTDLHSLLPHHGDSWRRSLGKLHPPRRVVWAPTLGFAEIDAEVAAVCRAAVDRLADAGTEIVEVDDLFDADPVLAWATIGYTGLLRRLEPVRDTEDWELLDPGLRGMLELLSGASAVDLARAMDTGHHLNRRMVETLHGNSVLLCPTVAGQTGPVGENGTVNGAPSQGWVSCTYPFNLTQSPAGTVCAGLTTAGLPVGLQVVGPQHGDVVVLRTLAHLEGLLGGPGMAPGW